MYNFVLLCMCIKKCVYLYIHACVCACVCACVWISAMILHSLTLQTRTINMNEFGDNYVSFSPMHISFNQDGHYLLVSTGQFCKISHVIK